MLFTRTLQAEIAKAISLRMPVVVSVSTVTSVVGLAALLTALVRRAIDAGRAEDAAGLDPSSAFLVLLDYGHVGVVVFGCWVLFQERERGSLRSALLATPARGTLFVTKAAVAAFGSLVIATLSVLGSYLARCLLTGWRPVVGSGDSDAQLLAGTVLYWTLLGLLSFVLSAALRNAIVAMCAILATTLAVSDYLLGVTPLARFLPDQAGAQLTNPMPTPGDDLGAALGLAVFCVWLAGAGVAGALSFLRWPAR